MYHAYAMVYPFPRFASQPNDASRANKGPRTIEVLFLLYFKHLLKNDQVIQVKQDGKRERSFVGIRFFVRKFDCVLIESSNMDYFQRLSFFLIRVL